MLLLIFFLSNFKAADVYCWQVVLKLRTRVNSSKIDIFKKDNKICKQGESLLVHSVRT